MKKRRILKRGILAVFIGFVLLLSTVILMMPGPIELTLNQKGFETVSYQTIAKSEYHNNGSWWGYNQKKLATLHNAIFSFDFDNANFEFGNPSLSNPYQCVFHITIDGITSSFGTANTERPCNVITDPDRNLVYYFAVEPTGENIGTNGNTAVARTMMYSYQYDPSDNSVNLLRMEEVDPPSSIGKIRQSVAIDEDGNLAIAYGEYSGWITVLTYEFATSTWTKHQTLSNPDQDSLMYCYIDLVSIDKFDTLCVQDTSTNDDTYYQYVKLFSFEDGLWTDTMVIDYRDHPMADKESQMVEHTEFKRIGEDLHIITRSNPLNEIKHFIVRDGVLSEQAMPLKGRYGWIRLMENNDSLYYVATKLGMFASVVIVEVETGKVVYQSIGIAMGSYMYVGEPISTGEIPVLFYPGWGETPIGTSNAKRLIIQVK